MKNTISRYLYLILVCVFLSQVDINYSEMSLGLTQSAFAGAAKGVKVAKVQKGEIAETVGGYGKLWTVGFIKVTSSFPFPVKVSRVYKRKGQVANQGEVLLDYDKLLIESNFEKSMQLYKQIESEIESFENGVLAKKELLAQKVYYLGVEVAGKKEALFLSEKKLNVFSQLLKKDLSYNIEYWEAENEVLSARSSLEKATFDMLSAKNSLNEYDDVSMITKLTLESRKAVAYFDLTQAEQWLQQTSVNIPNDVIVMDIFVDEEESVSAGKKIAEFAKVDPVIFLAKFHGEKSSIIKMDMMAEIVLDEFPYNVLTGKIVDIGHIVDRDDNTFEVQIELESLGGIPFMLGTRGLARVVSKRIGFTIPTLALLNPAGVPSVFIYKNGTVYLRKVEIGNVAGGRVEILGGLNFNDEVIVYGLDGLHEGEAVDILTID